MLEHHVNSPVTRRRLRSGPASEHVDGFADWLHRQGYKPASINSIFCSLAGWMDWMQSAGFTVHDCPAGLAACTGELQAGGRVRYRRGAASVVRKANPQRSPRPDTADLGAREPLRPLRTRHGGPTADQLTNLAADDTTVGSRPRRTDLPRRAAFRDMRTAPQDSNSPHQTTTVSPASSAST